MSDTYQAVLYSVGLCAAHLSHVCVKEKTNMRWVYMEQISPAMSEEKYHRVTQVGKVGGVDCNPPSSTKYNKARLPPCTYALSCKRAGTLTSSERTSSAHPVCALCTPRRDNGMGPAYPKQLPPIPPPQQKRNQNLTNPTPTETTTNKQQRWPQYLAKMVGRCST